MKSNRLSRGLVARSGRRHFASWPVWGVSRTTQQTLMQQFVQDLAQTATTTASLRSKSLACRQPLTGVPNTGSPRVLEEMSAERCKPSGGPRSAAVREELLVDLFSSQGSSSTLRHDCTHTRTWGTTVLEERTGGRAPSRSLRPQKADTNLSLQERHAAGSTLPPGGEVVAGGRQHNEKVQFAAIEHFAKSLRDACASADYPAVDELLRTLGNKKVLKQILDRKDSRSGRTPLMLAAQQKSYGTCRLLLQKGANGRARDAENRTAADYAMRTGCPRVCDVFVLYNLLTALPCATACASSSASSGASSVGSTGAHSGTESAREDAAFDVFSPPTSTSKQDETPRTNSPEKIGGALWAAGKSRGKIDAEAGITEHFGESDQAFYRKEMRRNVRWKQWVLPNKLDWDQRGGVHNRWDNSELFARSMTSQTGSCGGRPAGDVDQDRLVQPRIKLASDGKTPLMNCHLKAPELVPTQHGYFPRIGREQCKKAIRADLKHRTRPAFGRSRPNMYGRW
ncbi:unnamed protein product [Amoebophrya sp. A120]|nr:unnamed protein product [Amoebophrya sp. A120]|eukprot:GSA120T00023043001.1